MLETQSPTTGTLQAKSMMQECIDNCTRCHQICLETFNYSLWLGGRYNESVHLRLLLDCAEICETSANFMLRGSDLHRETCEACAVVCENCAKNCERYTVTGEGAGAPMSSHSGQSNVSKENTDDQIKRCAEICRQCAKSCREMAEMPLQM
jgi:hypothetical protein